MTYPHPCRCQTTVVSAPSATVQMSHLIIVLKLVWKSAYECEIPKDVGIINKMSVTEKMRLTTNASQSN